MKLHFMLHQRDTESCNLLLWSGISDAEIQHNMLMQYSNNTVLLPQHSADEGIKSIND